MKRSYTLKKWIQIGAGVALVAFGLLGSLALGGALDYEPAAAQAAEGQTQSDLTDSVAAMMQDHMGIDVEQAQAWASDMVPFMEEMHGDGAAEMVEYCSSASAEGMMGDNGTGAMMGGEFDHGSMMDGDREGMMGF